MNKKNIRIIINIVFLLVIVIIIAMVFKGSAKDIASEVINMSFVQIVMLIMCSVFFNSIEGVAYYFMARECNKDFTVANGIGCSYYCAFFKLSTLGSGTAASGIYYMNKHKVAPANSLSMITINYMFQKVAVALVCFICFVLEFPLMKKHYNEYFGYLLIGIVVTLLVVTGLIAVCMWKRFHDLLLLITNKIIKKESIKKKISRLSEDMTIVRKESKSLIENKLMAARILLLNMLKFMGWYMIPCVIIGKMDIHSVMWGSSVAALASALIGVIPMPGGAGSTEAMFYLLFVVITVKSKASAIMILYRCFTYFVPCILGMIYIIYLKLRHR